jgi:hypothetical protein
MIPKPGVISMKGNIIFGAAIALGAIFSVTAPEAQASCQSICAISYRACLADGTNAATCRAEQATCVAECSGSGIANAEKSKFDIKDQNGQELRLGQSRPASLIPQVAKS